MRFFVRLIACGAVALTAAGCDPTDKHYFTEGVGTNLYVEDTRLGPDYAAAQTELQDQYVAHICRQAGLDPSNCGVDTFSPKIWGLFVQAGMNDIDQRCDGYLTWLDNLRRSKAPFAKQITDTGSATNLIMQATGAGKASLAIVTAAFGLASQSFDNLSTRLLVEVPQSTVQAVVLSHQKQYREDLLGSVDKKIPPVVIASKPAAIYALRSYLRLCMPMTIETQINSIVASFSRGGPDALDTEPMISARTVGVTVIPRIAKTQSVKGLRELLLPNGAKKIDPAMAVYVKQLLGNPNVVIGPILVDPALETLRQRLAACIVARNSGKPCAAGSLANLIQQ
jgi:hypothetical protein